MATTTTTNEDIITLINQQNIRIKELEITVQNQSLKISFLEEKITNVQTNALISETNHKIASHVSKKLREEIDNLEQYGRRSCLVIDGLSPQDDREI